MNITSSDFIKIRKLHGYSQLQMAGILDVKQPTIFQIENDYLEISEKMRKKVIEKFDITNKRLERIRNIYSEFMER